MSSVAREKFLESLQKICAARGRTDEELSEEFRAALLTFGSRTDDNVECAARVEVGTTSTAWGADVRGMKLTSASILLSDVLYALEEAAIPPEVSEALPQLSPEQWRSAMRATLLVMLAFEERQDASLGET